MLPPSFSSHSSLPERILAVARAAGSRPFLRLLSAEGIPTELSYEDLLHQAALWSELYRKHRLKPGQRVVILVSHSVDSYAAFLGAMVSALVPAMLPPPSPKLSKERFGKTIAALLPMVRPQAVVLGGEMLGVAFDSGDSTVIRTEEVMSVRLNGPAAMVSHGTGRDVAFLQYSSGTTGLRKGVTISHTACLRQVDLYGDAIALSPADAIVSWLPLYHDMGLVACWLLPLLTGTPVTAMSPFDWVARPSMLIEAIRAWRPTLCWLPNFAFAHLARSVPDSELEAGDLSSIRRFVNCSEPVRQAAHDTFLSKFRKAGALPKQISTCYAMAETTFAITSSRLDTGPANIHVDPASLVAGFAVRPGAMALVSSGRAIGETAVRIADDLGVGLPDGTVGYLNVRSPSQSDGYFDNPQATAAVFADGELRTGDIGFIVDGEVFVLGRADDTILVAGRNLFPQDIEAVIDAVPGAIPGRSVAFGIVDDDAGTSFLVVLAESDVTSADEKGALERKIVSELVARLDVSPRVAKIMPRGWLTKSTSGKISRKSNRERYQSEIALHRSISAESVPADEGPLNEFVRRCVAAALEAECPADDRSLIMGGILDSFGLTRLLMELGARFHRRLPMPNVVGFEHFDSVEAIVRLLERVERGFSVQSRQMTYAARDLKLKALKASSEALDLLIVGSSTSFPLPSRLGEARGLAAFNLSVNSATVTDLYCLTRLAAEHRGIVGRLVVGLDVFAFKSREGLILDLRTVSFPELTRYLLPEDQSVLEQYRSHLALAAQRRRIDLQRLAEWTPGFWYSFDNRNGDLIVGEQDPTSAPDGSGADPKVHEMKMIFAEAFETLDPKQVTYLDMLAGFARTNRLPLDFVLMPLHPRLHKVLASSTVYPARRAEVVDAINRLTTDTIRLHDFPTPAAFGGTDEGFHDAYHLDLENAERLLHRVLGR